MSLGRAECSGHATGRRGPIPSSPGPGPRLPSTAPPHPTAPAAGVGGTLVGMRRMLSAAALPIVLLVAAPAAGAPAAAVPASTGYATPTGGAVLRLFDPPSVPWGRGHRGVDLGTDGSVRSPGPGVVSFAGPVAGRGVVTVTHPDGLRSSLEPVEGAPEVGTAVATGDDLGHAVAGHCPTLCVHWGVRRGDAYLDPLGLLGDTTVVLLE